MNQEVCLVVPRLERVGRMKEPGVILFLPYDWATYGNLCYYCESSGHGEANYVYYADQTTPGRYRPDLIEPVIASYRDFLRGLGGDVRVAHKLPPDWREKAWGWSRQPLTA